MTLQLLKLGEISPKTRSALPPDWDWKAPDYDTIWQGRATMLVGLRAEPARLIPLQEHYAGSAQGCKDFINDWGVTYNPKNAGSAIPTTMPFLLFPKQEEFIDWLYDHWTKRRDGLVEKSRDMGISWCCCAFAVWLWTFHPGSVVGFGSRKEDYVDKLDDPDSLLWKVRALIDMLPHEFKPGGWNRDTDAPFMHILNRKAQSVIKGEAGKNIGRGGRASIYFKDESAHYEHPESIDAALSQTTNVSIDVSTPNGEGNPFWHKAHGGKIDKFVFDWRDDPRKGKAWYANEVNRLTAVALAAEVDRDYSASVSNSFISSQLVTAAQMRGPADVKAIGPLRVGLDVARFGDDLNVLTFRRGRVVLRQVKWGKSDIVSTVGRTRQEILAFKRLPGVVLEQIAVDTIGVGAGAADMLRGFTDFAKIVVDVNSALRMTDGTHYNLRAFMWTQMKDWLEMASIPNDQELRVALTGLRYLYKAGELLIESKEDAKQRGLKSPDESDSLALSFAYPGPVDTGPPPPPPGSVIAHEPEAETGM